VKSGRSEPGADEGGEIPKARGGDEEGLEALSFVDTFRCQCQIWCTGHTQGCKKHKQVFFQKDSNRTTAGVFIPQPKAILI